MIKNTLQIAGLVLLLLAGPSSVAQPTLPNLLDETVVEVTASSLGLLEDAPMVPTGMAFDCVSLPVGVCDEIAAMLALAAPDVDVALIALYQDVYPNGQWGSYDCVYDRASNRSIIVERWGIHVEAGTLNGSTRNPIVNTNVYYPFVDTATGNVC